jgi:hypothetical protein
MKVGLIYVHHGQQDEKDIFMNDAKKPSAAYSEFARSLGVTVSGTTGNMPKNILGNPGRSSRPFFVKIFLFLMYACRWT